MINLPLAEQLRPEDINHIVGQKHLCGKDGIITRIIENKKPISILLWGPPGCGKTTLARLYANAFQADFVQYSAVLHGTTDIKKLAEEVHKSPLLRRQKIVFIDEIHRFNKAQQDAFLPLIENGTFILIGATTENPSFALNNALLSRLRVLTLNSLSEDDLLDLVKHYEEKIAPLNIEVEARSLLCNLAQGDGRHLYNMIENISYSQEIISCEKLLTLVQKRNALYDKKDEGHYNLISALHKSVRGSDPDAALYYLARMLNGGEDPAYIGRRIIRMAIEDIGLADPQALNVALKACQAFNQLGSPEGDLSFAQAVVYLALAPKSNSIYTAFKAAQKLAETTSHLSPPLAILNASTQLMKDAGYGRDYIYDHDHINNFSGQNYFPDNLLRQQFYQPREIGFEREMKKRSIYYQRLRAQKEDL